MCDTSIVRSNFIVNCGDASSADVLRLIGEARRAVEALSGIAMLAEVRHVRPDGTMVPAHVSADAIKGLLDPTGYTGLCSQMAREAVVRARAAAGELAGLA